MVRTPVAKMTERHFGQHGDAVERVNVDIDDTLTLQEDD